MAITNPDFIYVPKYDIYVQRSTRTFWKRCNRGRKTEITEDELVLIDKFDYSVTEYIKVKDVRTNRYIGVYYVFAEAFPELVGNAYLHALDPETFCELNHKNHVHNTWASNFPEAIEWTTPRINRADTSRRVHDADEKRAERLRKKREYSHRRLSDPEYREKHRKRDAENKRKLYHETRSIRKQQAEQLAAQLQEMAGLQKQQADERHQLADN